MLDTSVYSYISEYQTFDSALARLNGAFVKPVNEVFARYRLNTCRQNVGESLEDFLERLKNLSSNCNFTDLASAQIKETAIRDAFISGLQSGYIRQRILEDDILQLNDVFDKARRLEEARKNAGCYDAVQSHGTPENVAAPCNSQEKETDQNNCLVLNQSACSSCGGALHKRTVCTAKRTFCYQSGRKRPLCENVPFLFASIFST